MVRTRKRQVFFLGRDRVIERALQSLKQCKKRLLQHMAGRHLLGSPPGFLHCPSLTNHTPPPKRLSPGESGI